MNQDITDTLTERGKTYGHFHRRAELSQQLKRAIDHWQPLNSALPPEQQEALEMICSKISRIICGNNNHADSWHDIAGYAQLVADRLNGINR